MEQPVSPMTILGVIELDDRLSVERVRAILSERLLAYPRFSMRFGRGRFGRLRLESEPDFDIARHVRTIDDPGSEPALLAVLEGMAGTLLPEGRSPWEVLVAERQGGGTLLIPRLHHSLADGVALIQVLVSVTDDPPEHMAPDNAHHRRGKLAAAVRTVLESVRLALLPSDPATTLKAPLTGTKRMAWSREIPLEAVLGAAKASGSKINDVMLAGLAGGLRAVLASRGEEIPSSLRAMVPFNLRPPDPEQPLGNRFGLVLPDLPVGTPEPAERLLLVRRMMNRLKRNAQGAAAYALLQMMGFSAAVVESALVRFFGRKSSIVMTNVPGPREHLHFGGARISRLMFWVPQAGGIAVGVSLITYAGSARIGVLADAGSLPDPGALVEAYERELESLGVRPS